MDDSFDFDAIVIGSGFGGSVMTYRLAKAGLRVRLFERGKAYPPGTFPRSPWRMKTNFWDPSNRLHGMFNVWSFDKIGGVVSSGLGGGSLIYANVLLRKPADTFESEGWAISREDLEPHYDQAERMLTGQRYPFEVGKSDEEWGRDTNPFNRTSKTRAMEVAAGQIGAELGMPTEFSLPKLAVTFANPDEPPRVGVPIRIAQSGDFDESGANGAPPSLHEGARTRLTCQLCGECDLGCNYGSKNTLDLTYLSAAMLFDKKPCICPNHEVRRMEPIDGGGYRVFYVDHSAYVNGAADAPESRSLREQECTARYLILSAGSFGSTYLLLKSGEHFSKIDSRALGSRFCGNGDLLTVVRGAKLGRGDKRPRRLDNSYGPVITSAIRVEAGKDRQGRRLYHYVEDSGYPDFAHWMLEILNPLYLAKRFTQFAGPWVRLRFRLSRDSDISEEISRIIGDGTTSSTMMPLLGMGTDTPDGKMKLDGDRLALDWSWKSSRDHFKAIERTGAAIANVLNARFTKNPLGRLSRVVTVHPLGGCPMDYYETTGGRKTLVKGVVDTNGEVHGYKNFYIADGSVLPGPVGPNPSLTIAACANRFADHLIAGHSFTPGTGTSLTPDPSPDRGRGQGEGQIGSPRS
ncbi:MAG: GMC family oxidoreductase [Thermomicrobiales bacterium]|nr:GMC family oxidoreductase [Thermomicrobiales bacterium]